MIKLFYVYMYLTRINKLLIITILVIIIIMAFPRILLETLDFLKFSLVAALFLLTSLFLDHESHWLDGVLTDESFIFHLICYCLPKCFWAFLICLFHLSCLTTAYCQKHHFDVKMALLLQKCHIHFNFHLALLDT